MQNYCWKNTNVCLSGECQCKECKILATRTGSDCDVTKITISGKKKP